jgi:hypothetical protein
MIKRHGGMVFWRVGPVGGSIYVKAAARQRLAMVADVTLASVLGIGIGVLIALGV